MRAHAEKMLADFRAEAARHRDELLADLRARVERADAKLTPTASNAGVRLGVSAGHF
ncbi:MAG: hypothetical protein JOY82_25105 [Streptosporangiaceae bacterium]|nr:hypothetical protein [Streptosporangiaceae bacterium]MBV9857765.1 hypothetical protein [Streptosporangiaceae bacterium]